MSPDQAVAALVAALVGALSGYLDPVTGLPDPSAVVLQVRGRALGLGNLRGLDAVGPFSAVELRGGQIDCVVRFQVWGADPAAADVRMTALQGGILGAGADLWGAGILQLDGVAGELAVADRGAWSRTADYHVLFEYHLAPTSDAESLIAAVPVAADQEVAGSLVEERTTVTGDSVRWDQAGAAPLVLRGRRSVEHLSIAAFLPAPTPTGGVRLLRTSDDATGTPTGYPTLAAFLAAVADPVSAQRHGVWSSVSLADFVAAFDAADDLLLGDWDGDGVPDEYQVGQLSLDPPIPLPSARDRLEISLETSPLDHMAVVYLRASRALG